MPGASREPQIQSSTANLEASAGEKKSSSVARSARGLSLALHLSPGLAREVLYALLTSDTRPSASGREGHGKWRVFSFKDRPSAGTTATLQASLPTHLVAYSSRSDAVVRQVLHQAMLTDWSRSWSWVACINGLKAAPEA